MDLMEIQLGMDPMEVEMDVAERVDLEVEMVMEEEMLMEVEMEMAAVDELEELVALEG